MGQAKARKQYKEKVNIAVWNLMALFGLIQDQFDVVKASTNNRLTQDDINNLTAAANLIKKVEANIFKPNNSDIPIIQQLSESAQSDYNYQYLELQKKLDELNA